MCDREENRGTIVKTRLAIDTAVELKRKVDLEEEKFEYKKPENLMDNIQYGNILHYLGPDLRYILDTSVCRLRDTLLIYYQSDNDAS